MEVTRTPIMSSRPRCIVCKRALDFEADELDRIIDDNIWYCDDCFEAIAREWEEEYNDESN